MKEAVKVYDKAGLRGTLSLSTMDEKRTSGVYCNYNRRGCCPGR